MTSVTTRHWIASVDELSNGSRILGDVEGKEVAVFAQDDEYYAVANYCVHQLGPLCEGQLQETQKFSETEEGWSWQQGEDSDVIVCPWHAWRFDIASGDNVDDDRYRVPTYDVEVDDGNVYVVL